MNLANYLLSAEKNLGIDIIPLSVNFGEETYVDKFTITNEEFYEKLNKDGWLLLEHGFSQKEDVMNLLKEKGYVDVMDYKDLTDFWRVAAGRKI